MTQLPGVSATCEFTSAFKCPDALSLSPVPTPILSGSCRYLQCLSDVSIRPVQSSCSHSPSLPLGVCCPLSKRPWLPARQPFPGKLIAAADELKMHFLPPCCKIFINVTGECIAGSSCTDVCRAGRQKGGRCIRVWISNSSIAWVLGPVKF